MQSTYCQCPLAFDPCHLSQTAQRAARGGWRVLAAPNNPYIYKRRSRGGSIHGWAPFVIPPGVAYLYVQYG